LIRVVSLSTSEVGVRLSLLDVVVLVVFLWERLLSKLAKSNKLSPPTLLIPTLVKPFFLKLVSY
jgi:hypothetical protein